MTVGTQAQAVLLLTAWLGKHSRDDVKPMTPAEWGRFAAWLHSVGRSPDDLLASDPESVLEGWVDRTVTTERIKRLLDRAGALGLVIEKWERAGLWVMVRSDPDYPSRLKSRLRHDAPPLLIGCGDRELMGRPGIAVVGSRDASDDDLQFARELGSRIVGAGLTVVSGAARGIDEAAMLGALDAEGQVVGILADKLLRAVTSAKYRSALATGQLVLVTPFNPEAGFNVGNAMARNKYVYCCSDAAVIVTSGNEKGGTWHGAVEALRAHWVPVWVRCAGVSPPGNSALVRKGAAALREDWPSPEALLHGDAVAGNSETGGLFDRAELTPAIQNAAADVSPLNQSGDSTSEMSFVEFFVQKLAQAVGANQLSAADIAETLSIGRAQTNAWLKEAVAQGLVRKTNRPVRYAVVDGAKTHKRTRGGRR